MARTIRIEIATNAIERALLDAAAAISHPSAKGGNTARMIREAALEAARRTLQSHSITTVRKPTVLQ